MSEDEKKSLRYGVRVKVTGFELHVIRGMLGKGDGINIV